jgi:hypothetical protein
MISHNNMNHVVDQNQFEELLIRRISTYSSFNLSHYISLEELQIDEGSALMRKPFESTTIGM